MEALNLAQALASSGAAIEEAVANDDLEPFRQAVPFGVSSNLCDAVANLARNGAGVEIGMSWASVRPTAAEIRRAQPAVRVLRTFRGHTRRSRARIPRYLSIPENSA